MDEFSKTIFDPGFGLFNVNSEHLLTANPDAPLALGDGYLELFYFVGKMLGKALYEKLLFQSQFSLVFLNTILGRINQFDDLSNYDKDIHRQLVQLKKAYAAGEDISQLDLYFELTRKVYDQMVPVELIPNGSKTKVTNGNFLEYIHRYAYYLQNQSVATAAKAFLRGFRELIPIHWIRLFSPKELGLLIYGEDRKLDLLDLQRNCHYSSGYHESQPYIQGFWKIVDEMSIEDQQQFLRFVTSSIRSPLLGFKELNPKFAIQKVSQYEHIPVGSDHSNNPAALGLVPRLPSAATCMNLLKLPQYENLTILREKLLYAIRSNSGFQLS